MYFFKSKYDVQCHLCEENNLEYRCFACNYILCKECLRKLIHLNCPQCRNDIILTDNQRLNIRNNLGDENAYHNESPHNVIVNISHESRGFYIMNRYYRRYIFNKFFYCLCIISSIIYPIICYFIGYYITESHKHPIGNLFLGFLLSLISLLGLFILINIMSSCF